MQHRWEGYLLKAEAEAPRIKQQAANAPSVREQAQQAGRMASSEAGTATEGGSTSAGQAYGTTSYEDTRQF